MGEFGDIFGWDIILFGEGNDLDGVQYRDADISDDAIDEVSEGNCSCGFGEEDEGKDIPKEVE